MNYRIEHDTMGEVQVPADRYWGAQTQRSYQNFKIGTEKMPKEIIVAFAYMKKAAAQVNMACRKLDERRCSIISSVCDEIISGQLDRHFPLSVWQTGSGTQSNMNVNEVIANRGNEITGERLLHPNDHVNLSQSSNDTFPTAMHISAVQIIYAGVLPEIEKLSSIFRRLEEENSSIIKIGRTHLQDATPIRFSQEISGWRAMLDESAEMIRVSIPMLSQLAIGGTAVGTGLNAPMGFDRQVCNNITKATGIDFVPDPNKFHALTSKDAIVFAHGALKALAANLMKIANDIRWLASGPRCGIGEITIPENEPGSSIMPGKVNPTQCEALTMVAVQVMANDVAIGMAASQGNFELNVYMPVTAYAFLQSARLLGDAMKSFGEHCASGIRAERKAMEFNLYNSLMLVTCLTPHIGYEKAAAVAKEAFCSGSTLRQAALAMGVITAEAFDEAMQPDKMV